MTAKLPSNIDKVIGQKIRWRRRKLKLTQEKLGEMLQITFQQIQKYENGANRVAAGRLYEIASALQVPVSYFYDGLDAVYPAVPTVGAVTKQTPRLDADAMELVAAYQGVSNPQLRAQLRRMMLTTAETMRQAQQRTANDA